MKTYNVDIDGILCECSDYKSFKSAVPKKINIEKVNNLFDSGCYIRIYTSRRKEDKEVTENWLKENDVKYNEIVMDKPLADYYIDDCAINNLPYIRPNVNQEENLVICLSGGLDSTIAYYIALEKGYKNIKCLFFNVGQEYYNKEKNILDSLNIPYTEIDISSAFKDLKKETHIIENRNSIMANIAVLYGNRVWICGLKYEDHYLMFDKNQQFYNYVSLSLTQSTGKRVVVETPYKEWSKTDILNYCKENNLLDVAEKTTSCYHESLQRCGECSLCVRRFVAEKTAGIDIPFYHNPLNSLEYKKLIEKYKTALKNGDFSHYSKERILETLKIK